MIIKNTTGSTKSYGFANKAFVTLANNASATIPDDPDTVADAIVKANAGLLEIVEGPATSKLVGSGTAPDTILITIATANAADEDTVTLGDYVLEVDDDDALADADAIAVELGGSAALTGVAFKTAINASAELAALGITAVASGIADAAGTVYVVLTYANTATALADFTVSKSGANLTVSKVTGAAGVTRRRFAVERTLANTTTDLIFVTDLETITSVRLQARTATTGVIKALDGNARIVGNVVVLDNSGDVDLAATDVVYLEALGK